ncbi:WD40-like Beta Propeller Repeat [Actinacidiphila yanglinensis]|uniref:WD40-like Beta Propeller Repeat n=1 Tax=Actinacidiphila yanglinensis TaxID=310779 RepID=A0A1H6A258_9ACTN|nr:PD40 domain-containing protein [Actinacidiphila yanglinensis]SEG42135.1 WD40-like Beta Propeller Repeat [Actinacidiphila yanglinensis]
MDARSRRRLATLASAASLAAGVLGATAPQAGALTISAKTGQISVVNATGVTTADADGGNSAVVPHLPNTGRLSANWAPDGSRLVAGGQDPTRLTSTRLVGDASHVTTEWPQSASGTQYTDATFWLDGSDIVTSNGTQLYYGPSDASFGQQPLLTGGNQQPAGTCDSHPSASILGALAFERSTCGASGSDIWTLDPSADTVQRIVTDGADPAFSADGSQLAFTRVVDGNRQIFTAAADGTGAKQVTSDAVDHTDPSWDPAGGRIAYGVTDASAGTASTKILDLSDGTSTTFSTDGSKPAWQPVRSNTLDRVYGTGGITIDQAASRFTFDATGAAHEPGLITAHSAVLVNKANATYATPAIALAAEKQGPVLMTSSGSLDATVTAELKRTLPKGSTVYLDGNTTQLSAKVSSQITALGYTALRMDGADLASVSARVATQITKKPDWVFVADGMDYHDPVSAATAAGSLGYKGLGVVLLVKGTTIPTAVKTYLNSLNPATTGLVTVGANARTAMENTPLAQQWEFYDISGSSYEQTAVNLANFWWAGPNVATVDESSVWSNSVVGNAVTAIYGPALWSTAASLSTTTAGYLTKESASVQEVVTFGGNAQYSVAQRTALGNAIGISSTQLSTMWWAGGVLPAASATPSARSLAKSLPTIHGPAAEAPASGRPSLIVDTPGAHLTPKNDRTR